MRRLRRSFVTGLVACALAMTLTSSVQATFTLSSERCGPKPALCWDEAEKGTNLRELVGEEEVTATQEPEPETLFEEVLGEITVHLVCKETSFKGSAVQTEPLVKETTIKAGGIAFKGCALLAPLSEKCSVAAELTTRSMTASLPAVGEVLLKPSEGEVIVEFLFTGEKCPATLKGTQTWSGSTICLWLEPEVDLKGHLLECVDEDSKIKQGGNTIKFLVELEVHMPTLEKTRSWSLAPA